MANIDLYEIALTPYHDVVEPKLGENLAALPELANVSGGEIVIYYKMTGRDSACTDPTYHSWVTTGNPDFTGAQAGTLPCGGPLVDIYIADTWS